jgi:hypothetical protein
MHGTPFLEAADLPVGRTARASRSRRHSVDLRPPGSAPFSLVVFSRSASPGVTARPRRSSAASKRRGERAGRGCSEAPPRSGRPPGRPGRERVAIGEIAWLLRRRRLVPFPAEQELGRFEEERGARGACCSETLSSKRPTSRSAGTRALAIGEIAWLVRRRRLVPFPAEQELGRFEEAWRARGAGLQRDPSSKRPTSRSAGTRLESSLAGRDFAGSRVRWWSFAGRRSAAAPASRCRCRSGSSPPAFRPPAARPRSSWWLRWLRGSGTGCGR